MKGPREEIAYLRRTLDEAKATVAIQRARGDTLKAAFDLEVSARQQAEAVLRDWVAATPEIKEDTRGVTGMQQDCLRRARRILEGKS